MVELNRPMLVAKLARLAEEVRFIRERLPASAGEFAADPIVVHGILHAIQLCGQVVVDVALHVISAESLPVPQDARDAVRELGRRLILPADLAERLSALVGLRNLIVHEYMRIDLAIVHSACASDLGDLARLADAVARRYSL